MFELIPTNQTKEFAIDSREVAAMVDRRHSDLLRDIKNYTDAISLDAKLRSVDFFVPSEYEDSTRRTLPCYLVTRKGCDMIANKMTGQKGILFTAKYVTRFEEMERATQKRMSQAEILAALAQEAVKLERKVIAAEQKINSLVETMTEEPQGNWQDTMSNEVRRMCYKYDLNYHQEYSELYMMVEAHGVDLKQRVSRKQKRMLEHGATKAQINAITKLHVISEDAKLRTIFEGLLNRRKLRYSNRHNQMMEVCK